MPFSVSPDLMNIIFKSSVILAGESDIRFTDATLFLLSLQWPFHCYRVLNLTLLLPKIPKLKTGKRGGYIPPTLGGPQFSWPINITCATETEKHTHSTCAKHISSIRKFCLRVIKKQFYLHLFPRRLIRSVEMIYRIKATWMILLFTSTYHFLLLRED